MSKQWQAQWIWGGEEESPRNEWRCFRSNVEVPEEGWRDAELAITADSRYVLTVNGAFVGRGPVRSWPEELAYDTYEIGHLLERGKRNTVAVFVNHYGITNFYYLRGRGGLLAQVDLLDEGGERTALLATGDTWITSRYLGYNRRSQRMSCQQGFAEHVDASAWDGAWTAPDYDDSGWARAHTIGPAGIGPWSRLQPRDIPMLTEEPVYPVRVESLKQVRSLSWSTALDIRTIMAPDSIDHANPIGHTGYVATILHVPEACKAELVLTHGSDCFRACSINGHVIEDAAYTGIQPEKRVEMELVGGDNLLLIDTSGHSHTGKLHLGIYCDSELEVRQPMGEGTDAPFVSIGPFGRVEHIDHQPRVHLDMEDPDYLRVMQQVVVPADLAALGALVRPVDPLLASEADVLGLSIYRHAEQQHSVPAELQRMVMPHALAAELPLYAGWDTEVVVDFGKEWSGYLSFELDAAEGTIIDLYGYEYMLDEYRQDTYGLDNTIRYVCRAGRQRYESPIRRGFRYVMVTVRGATAPVRFYNLQVTQSNYPVAEVGTFRCSDALLGEIFTISRHTTRLCMEDTFVDCPAYEQAFWVGDSRNEALVSNYLFGVSEIVKRCLRLVPGSREQTPLYADQVPSGWNSVIPNWTFFWAIACHEYYEQTADLSFAEEIYPHIAYTLEHYLQNINTDGLLEIKGWNLLDWSPMDQPGEGVVTHQNLFLTKTLRVAAAMAELAGRDDEASRWQSAAQSLHDAINTHLWDEERQAYLDCIHKDGRRSSIYSMQTQTVAHLTGVAGGRQKEQMEAYLLSPPQEFVQIGSPFMSFFYYEALAAAGEAERIVDDIRHNFGQMVRYGATTCWEMYPNFKENRANPNMLTRSHCHAWSAAPAYFLGTQVLGVQRTAPGWRTVEIAPQPCGLTWARGSVPLPELGRIDVDWQISGEGEIRIRVEHPADIEVDVRVPEGYAGKVETIAI
ncbi:family 78 glycoside hydrolase catalytic domain [Paenibacillus sp. 1P07SE]|uniref:family 78 glycoside hydrolase catalytic domain n=1 Tax=Paenibacillus sp. 1P07SE TaxID=3132209 RepID=UPI0039A5C234